MENQEEEEEAERRKEPSNMALERKRKASYQRDNEERKHETNH